MTAVFRNLDSYACDSTPLGTLQLLARARRAGTQIGAFCQAIHREQGELLRTMGADLCGLRQLSP
jgi:hypothetical protein